MALIFAHPFTCLVSGSTGSGKTEFIYRILKHVDTIIDPAPQRILWCYGAYQEKFASMSGIDFHEGLPDLSEFDGSRRTLLIIDDLMTETDQRVSKIFTKLSHHANTSVIYITQNLFYGGKENRTIMLNAQYMVLFKNPRDATQNFAFS